ncbi:MAG: hypothetical protein HZB26_13005 [Candidatus Hydrogenedentes bacterium]|nr:hypothetical protein [Candidatus Hydrogenedentota bacterium]
MSPNRNTSNLVWFAIPVMLIAIAGLFIVPVIAPGALDGLRGFLSRLLGGSEGGRPEAAPLFLLLALGAVCFAAIFAAAAGRRGEERRRQRIAPYFSELLTLADRAESADDSETLAEILGLMMASYRRAEREWLAGNLDTEHMRNLYAAHQLRCDHIAAKTGRIQIRKLREQCARIYSLMANHIRQERDAAAAQSQVKRIETPAAPAAKPESPKVPLTTVTATVEDTEETLPDIVLPPDDSKTS